MSDVIKFKQGTDHAAPEKKKGVVTGIQDRSDVERMIQRYLELAESALKPKSPAHEEEVSA